MWLSASAEAPVQGPSAPADRSIATTTTSMLFAGMTVWLVVTVLQPHHPMADPAVPWWLLAGIFALSELDGFGVARERGALSSPVARVPLVIGLTLTSPLTLLSAHLVGTSLAWTGRIRRAPGERVLDLLGSVMATAIGAVVYVSLTGAFERSGPEGALVSAVAAVVVVLVSVALSASRQGPARTGAPRGIWNLGGTLIVNALSVGTGLVVIEVVRADPYAAWLLSVPAGAAYLVGRRYLLEQRRAGALAALHEVANRIQRAPDLADRLRIAVAHARAVTRATDAELTLQDATGAVIACEDAGGGGVVTRRVATVANPSRVEVAGLGPADTLVSQFGAVRGAWRRGGSIRRESVSVAIPEHGVVTGAFTVGRSGGRRFSRAEVRALETVATVLGPPLETTRVVDDLTDRRERDAEVLHRLEELNRELERVSDAKTVFLATTSHELRAPLTALQAEAELLGMWVGEPERLDDCRKLITGVGSNTRRLLRHVDDLLDLSRITADRLELRRGPGDLAAIATDVVSALGPVAAEQQVDLQATVPDLAPLEADEGRLWQVLANLVQNATRATSPGGAVRVTVETATSGPVVHVSDDGVGLAPAELERIFGPFEQATTEGGGLGLGLTIARHLVEQHGGTLTARSTPGLGSCFTARFPAVAGDVPATPQREGSPPGSG